MRSQRQRWDHAAVIDFQRLRDLLPKRPIHQQTVQEHDDRAGVADVPTLDGPRWQFDLQCH